MKIKPLPCPFCGRVPKFHRVPASLAKPEIDKAFWSLSCDDRAPICPAIVSVNDDDKKGCVSKWNTRTAGPVSQIPITIDDKPPFVARCGRVLLSVQSVAGEGNIVLLKGVILEGRHYNDRGEYEKGDSVVIGPITDFWRRISLI